MEIGDTYKTMIRCSEHSSTSAAPSVWHFLPNELQWETSIMDLKIKLKAFFFFNLPHFESWSHYLLSLSIVAIVSCPHGLVCCKSCPNLDVAKPIYPRPSLISSSWKCTLYNLSQDNPVALLPCTQNM